MWPQMGTGRGLFDEILGMCRAWQVSSSISGLKGFFPHLDSLVILFWALESYCAGRTETTGL